METNQKEKKVKQTQLFQVQNEDKHKDELFF